MADHLPVEHRLFERHRDVVLRLKTHGGVELVLVGDRRKLEGSHRDSLIGDTHPDAARELVLGEERLQGVPERLGIGDLALVEDPRVERGDGVPGDLGRAVDRDFGRGNAAGLDLEADELLLGGLVEHCAFGCFGGSRPRFGSQSDNRQPASIT